MKLYIGGANSGVKELALANNPSVINDFNSLVREWINSGEDINIKFNNFLSSHNDYAIVSYEIGCGLVPATEEDINYRDLVGKFQQELAKNSTLVIRVICGLEQIIKNTEG